RLVPRPPHILHPESLVHRPLRKMLFHPPAANTLSASQSRLSSLAPPARLPRVLVPLYASFVRDLSGDRPRKELANTLDASLSPYRSEEHTSELQSRSDLVCRLLLEKKKKKKINK